ncbi:MAG: hypothetical protein ACK4YP_21490 [Myxococcota bacterium]
MRFVSMWVFVSVLLTAALPARAADWRARVSADIVKFVDGKMKLEHFKVCEVKVPNARKSSLQVRTYAEAPATGAISRDFFVSSHATMSTMMEGILGQQAAGKSGVSPLKALDCKRVDAPIGQVDYDFAFYMTVEGYQIDIKDHVTGESGRESKTWESTFKD